MEDLAALLRKTEEFEVKLEKMRLDFMKDFREKLWSDGSQFQIPKTENVEQPNATALTEIQNLSTPIQKKKRPKRLSSLNEDDVEVLESHETLALDDSPSRISQCNNDKQDARIASPQTEPAPAPRKINTIAGSEENVDPELVESALMPPPPVPSVPATATVLDQSSTRPQRAAKLKSEKNLKEPALRTKLRRPTEEVKIKLEHEQRPSQLIGKSNSTNQTASTETTLDSNKAEESLIVVPSKPSGIIELSSEDEANTKQTHEPARTLRVKVKKEKHSFTGESDVAKEKPPATVPMPVKIKSETSKTAKKNTSNMSSASSATLVPEPEIKKHKKKNEHKPIKIERFSELDRASPVSTRSRRKKKSNAEKKAAEEETEVNTENNNRPGSIYEDAVADLPNDSKFATPPPPPTAKEVADNNKDSKKENKTMNETTNIDINKTYGVTVLNATKTVTPNSNATMILDSATMLGPAVNNATMVLNSTKTIDPVGGNATIVLGAAPDLDGTRTITTETAGNETFQVFPNAQTTFVMDNPNATRTVNNARDDVNCSTSTKQSMETARDTTMPQDDSIITDDESDEIIQNHKGKSSAKTATNTASGGINRPKVTPNATKSNLPKMANRNNELFNPLLQSPVKFKVEAFENAAQAAKAENKKVLGKKTKENTSSATGVTTPVIGRLQCQNTGRFLTPTQTSNLTQSSISAVKKAPNSASKAMAFPKATAVGKTLSRENSGDDFRKNFQQLAEERKKQREQKHLLAAQQREAKERERAERLNKLAKEREEKRLKKKEIDEIQRKLRLQEEAEKQRAAKERELILLQKQQQQQMAMKQMLPPPPKQSSKYTFEMLHEDDSTDEETKTSYKRPPPPLWSRSHVRGVAIVAQQGVPTSIIDSFFSVAPTTPDLREIFPNIDARHLKRNSSAMWSTPPRYSELPKY